MVERVALGWVSAESPLLEGVPDIGFSTSAQGETIRWGELKRRYVGDVQWAKPGTNEALHGMVEVGVHGGRLVGAVFAGAWGTYPISPGSGLAVAFHVPSAQIQRVELHGSKAKHRSLQVQLHDGDRLTFTFEMVIGQSRQWRAKLDNELASEIVCAMRGVPAVTWVAEPGRPEVQVAA